MAIVDLDKGTSGQPGRRDKVFLLGLGAAILAFAAAIWLSAPHSTTTLVLVPATPPSPHTTAIPSARLLTLPANMDNVDLFLVPERIANENLIWTLRSIVRIRGGVGIASVEGPAIVTWTEKGFQYWMVSPTRSTDELIKIADDLR